MNEAPPSVKMCMEGCGVPAQYQLPGWLPLCQACTIRIGNQGYEAQKAAWDRFKEVGEKGK